MCVSLLFQHTSKRNSPPNKQEYCIGIIKQVERLASIRSIAQSEKLSTRGTKTIARNIETKCKGSS